MNRRRAASPSLTVLRSSAATSDRQTLGRCVDLFLSDPGGDDRSRERDLVGGSQQGMGPDLVEVTPKKISLFTTCRGGVCPCHRGEGSSCARANIGW